LAPWSFRSSSSSKARISSAFMKPMVAMRLEDSKVSDLKVMARVERYLVTL
jgi:hypothetical protein